MKSPKSEVLTWQSQSQPRPKGTTAEYAEYAEKGVRPSLHFRVFREGMSFVTGAPWNTQDAVAERTEAVSP